MSTLIIDQLRYILGSLIMLHILCEGTLPHRAHFPRRLCLCGTTAILLALAYVPVHTQSAILFRAPYWLGMSFVLVAYVYTLYVCTLPGALFRTMMAAFTENVPTVLLRYGIDLLLCPDLSVHHTGIYLLCMLFVYLPFFILCRSYMARQLHTDENSYYIYQPDIVYFYLAVYLAYTVILGSCKSVIDLVLSPVQGMQTIVHRIQIFTVLEMLILSILLTTVIWYAYRRLQLHNENEMIRKIARDRQTQYEFSRENIEMINRKSHDLKHQLLALEQLAPDARRELLEQTRQAIDFYDSVLKTGNPALDTLLTEKSVYCTNRHIRLSCTVHTQYLETIDLVDLYTLLGNALDNAIESTLSLPDPEKRVISLAIWDRDAFLFLEITNYYTGSRVFRDGLPLTTHLDTNQHGYGMQSMQSIARHYGGKLLAEAQDGIFTLQVLLPMATPPKRPL